MSFRYPSVCALTSALFLFSVSPARAADPPPDAKKAEAAQRFDRGLQLFDDGDNSGALAEFKRTYELFPNPMVLYNIGLVYAAMGRPVNSVDALEPAIKGGGLPPKQLERATSTLEDQKARIGRLTVTTNPEGARIEVDNVEVAKTPLAAPLRIAEGSHIVGAVAEGFAPARKEVVVAGNSEASLAFELVPTQGKQLANLTVRTETRGADVRVDGEVSGKTPLATSITLVAGHHKVELRRAGYVTQTREVDVGAGATGELSFSLAVDPATLGAEGATLALDSGEHGMDLTVDGEHKGPYTAPLRLPKGLHHLGIATAGFYPVERDVTLDATQTNVVHVELEPTPEKRSSYEGSAYFHRTWGWVGIIGGAVIGGGGAAYLAINAGPKRDALAASNTAADNVANAGKMGAETGPLVCHTSGVGGNADQCNLLAQDALDHYNSVKNRDIIGFVGIGVGAAVLVTGVVLLVTGEDPHRYDRPASRSLGRSKAPRFALTPGPGQVGTGFQIAF
jgi:PEGA domain